MKILYVSDAIAIWGGLERVLVEKANYLADNYGYEIHLVTVNQGEHPIIYELSNHVHYKDLNIKFHSQYLYKGLRKLIKRYQLWKLYVKRLKSYIESVNPDIVISVRPELTSGLVKAKKDIPLIFESHGSCLSDYFIKYDLNTYLKVLWNNLSVKHARMVVALTNGDASNWRKRNSNVCVIPNLVHLNNTGYYSTCEAKTVIYVGRFSKQKDIGSLLKIWAIVYQRHPDWNLQIFGGFGDEQERLLSEIRMMNANIYVNQPVKGIFEKYSESSILLLTSCYEPFGLVLPEAMSCGLPVVVFDCPYGPADIITDGVDGFLIKNKNIEEFADKVCMLIENEELRRRLGKAGVLSSQRYRADNIMPQWKNLFNQLSNK